MAITRVAGQQTGANADNSTQVTCAYPGNVTAGNVLIISVYRWQSGNDPFVLADISKSSGTATLGTFTLDATASLNTAGSYYINVAVYSVPVVGSGSCTIRVAGAPGGSYLGMGLAEVSGADVSANRVEDTATATGASGAPSSGDGDSAGGALLAGALVLDASSQITITPDSAFTTIYSEGDGSAHVAGAVIDRIVASGTTDSASWTAPTTIAWAAVLAVYKAAADATPTSLPPPNIARRMAVHLTR